MRDWDRKSIDNRDFDLLQRLESRRVFAVRKRSIWINDAPLLGPQAQGPSVLLRKLCPFTPKPGANGARIRLLVYGPQDDEF
jgi:hypothetical protein